MKIIRLSLLSIATFLGSLVASAQQAPTEAIISSLSGSATVLAPGATQGSPAVVGQKLPEGSTIITADGASVVVQSHQGIETGIGAKSSVVVGVHSVSADGIRTAVLDLKKGTTVSVLDPSKRATNNYAIRTPRGVAAARGTTYSTTVKLSSGGEAIVTVNTLTGNVSFSIVGGATISVAEGKSASDKSAAATSISAAISSATPAEQQDIAEALKATVAVVAAISQTTGTSNDGKANALLVTVANTVTTAANEVAKSNPTLATTIVTNTVVAVQQYAGSTGAAAIATIDRVADSSIQAAVDAAVAAPAAPVTVTVNTNAAGETTTITAPVPAPTSTQPEPDITIVVSPSSP